jgi:hypothetical protein
MSNEVPKFTVLKTNQTLAQSLLGTTFTLAGTAFLIYLSQGSNWWTFINGSLFLLCLWGKCCELIKNGRAQFHTKAEVVAWANSLPEDEA